MARSVPRDSLASRILLLLSERYPVTLRDVALALSAREDVLRREVVKLAAAGLVVVEPLGDESYVALSGAGFTHLGLSSRDMRRLRDRKPPPPRPRDEHDPSFG